MKPLEEENKENLTVEQILKHFMKEHFATVKEDDPENNNSFIFLEKNSLNLLLAYLLTNTKSETSSPANTEADLQTLEKLNHMIQDSENQFKEIINVLKEMT